MKRTKSRFAMDQLEHRRLKIFASDPMQAAEPGNRISIDIPNEKLAEGPLGSRFEVIDYDGAHGCFYPPVDLDKAASLKQGGLEQSETDPRFHQQMVYAVAMRTLESFESAMGRQIRFYLSKKTTRLRLLPHAFYGANACYVPQLNAILFGYFRDSRSGKMVYTCLSHDVIVHELTHAVVDRLRDRFMEPTNPDVLAFHEGFADIVALFQHFSFEEYLKGQIQKTGFDLLSGRQLFELARQIGYATGADHALRSAIDTGSGRQPSGRRPTRLGPGILEVHQRGSILVAAVFDGFINIFKERTRDLLDAVTHGAGHPPGRDARVPPSLVNLIAAEASGAAQDVLNMGIRAFDYMPPVDVTFADYLRALVTADYELHHGQESQIPQCMARAFGARGIRPENIATGEPLIWDRAPSSLKAIDQAVMQLANNIRQEETALRLKNMEDILIPRARRPRPGAGRDLETSLKADKQKIALALHHYAVAHAQELNLVESPKIKIRVEGFHTSVRIKDGQPLTELIFQLTQHDDSEKDRMGGISFWGGTTVVVEADGQIRYVISKPLPHQKLTAEAYSAARERQERQRAYLAPINMADPNMAYGGDDYFNEKSAKERMRITALLEGVIS
jgi:hypothetical protein